MILRITIFLVLPLLVASSSAAESTRSAVGESPSSDVEARTEATSTEKVDAKTDEKQEHGEVK